MNMNIEDLEQDALETLMNAKGIYQCVAQDTLAESLAALDKGLQELKEDLVYRITEYYKGEES